MAESNHKPQPLTTAVLLLAGGVAGYAVSRWLASRRQTGAGDSKAPASSTPDVATPPAPPATRPAASRLSRLFDPIFHRYRGDIPIEYLRALASRESDMNPAERTGPAWGLMQVIEEVRRDYNRAHRTAYTREHLLDPAVSVAIASWLLGLIIAGYAKRHPDVPNLRADWNNPRFVELLTWGWNAGYSDTPRGGGVGSVATYLAARGQTDITIDDVHRAARAAGASRHLSNAGKVAWSKSVAALYLRERAAAARTEGVA
jgi:hypothetical protein